MTNSRSELGFSLIELLIVVVIFAIGAGIAAAIGAGSLPRIRADAEAQRVIAALRSGRETAMGTRREVEVRFDGSANTVTLLKLDGAIALPLESVALGDGVQFQQFSGQGDTPDQFGASAPIDFGDSTTLKFDADGSLVDESGLPANGTLFLGLGDQSITARAITLTGTTARARLYRWMPSGTGGAWDSH